jgi:hypothetical protein
MSETPGARPSTIGHTLLWIVPCLVGVTLLARGLVWLQHSWAKVGLVSVVAGVSLAALLIGVWRLLELWPRRPLLATFLMGLLLIAAQHVCFYLDYRAQHLASVSSPDKLKLAPQIDPATKRPIPVTAEQQLAAAQFAAQLQPAGPTHYFAVQARENWLLWVLDLAIVLAVSRLVVRMALVGSDPNQRPGRQDSLRAPPTTSPPNE